MPQRIVTIRPGRPPLIEERPFTPEQIAEQATGAREAARQRINDHMIATVDALSFTVSDADDVRHLRNAFLLLVPAARSANAQLAAAIYQYARDKIAESTAWDKTTADAYDPAADPGWPA